MATVWEEPWKHILVSCSACDQSQVKERRVADSLQTCCANPEGLFARSPTSVLKEFTENAGRREEKSSQETHGLDNHWPSSRVLKLLIQF
jgi:hypothetical protein